MSLGSRIRRFFLPASVEDSARSGIGSLRTAMRLPRPTDSGDEARLRSDFSLLLERWELAENQLPKFLSHVKFDVVIWVCLGLLGFAVALYSSLHGALTALLFSLVWIVVAAVRLASDLWILSIIRARRYIPFSEWLGLSHRRSNGT